MQLAILVSRTIFSRPFDFVIHVLRSDAVFLEVLLDFPGDAPERLTHALAPKSRQLILLKPACGLRGRKTAQGGPLCGALKRAWKAGVVGSISTRARDSRIKCILKRKLDVHFYR